MKFKGISICTLSIDVLDVFTACGRIIGWSVLMSDEGWKPQTSRWGSKPLSTYVTHTLPSPIEPCHTDWQKRQLEKC